MTFLNFSCVGPTNYVAQEVNAFELIQSVLEMTDSSELMRVNLPSD